MAVPRAMARPLGPRMFALPVGGKENNQGGAARDKTLFGDVDDGENNNAPSTSSSVPPEWALVELQGEVQPPAGAGPEDSFTAGRLVLKPNGGVELIVGNHLLEGTFVDLKKPFAVLKKEGGRSGNNNGGGGGGGEEGRREGHSGGGENSNNETSINGSGSSSSQSDNTRYKVVGVVRRKCLFKARPRALIARLT